MDIKRPLAYRARPQKLNEIVGQDHLCGPKGVITKMLQNERLFSLILYGPPGVGKTTIANVIASAYGLSSFTFNASTDKKARLIDIINTAKNYGCLLIVDEIHRMNKDVQDYLLPHVEAGNVLLIGLTTNNPYHSVNPAVRSRCHVLKLNQLNQNDIIKRLKQVVQSYKDELDVQLTKEVYSYIAQLAGGEMRSAINAIELLSITFPKEKVSLQMAKEVLLKPSLSLDKDEDNFYNILSAFQKSIRGSNVDAALHYLARLIAMEDLSSILRRMTVIAYEDIGLANPAIVSRMDACVRACERVGFPEARIPLSMMVIDLALSPKSNSAVASIDAALEDVMKGKTYKIPNHLINVANFEKKDAYLYPHSFPDAFVKQQYLPSELIGKTYYKGKETGKYERALLERYDWLKEKLFSEE
jgi:putative ATPase